MEKDGRVRVWRGAAGQEKTSAPGERQRILARPGFIGGAAQPLRIQMAE